MEQSPSLVFAMGIHSKILLLLLLQASLSFAFGSVAKQETMTPDADARATFTLLLWGTNESVEITAQQIPETWSVSIDPQHILLDEILGDEYIETGDGYHAARIVHVNVVASDRIERTLRVVVRSIQTDGQLSFAAERPFYLIVTGEKAPQLIQNDTIPLPETKPEEQKTVEEFPWLIVIGAVVIILASIAIYRHS